MEAPSNSFKTVIYLPYNATGSSPYIFLFQLKVPREVTIEAVN